MLEVQGISISPLLGPGDIQNEQSGPSVKLSGQGQPKSRGDLLMINNQLQTPTVDSERLLEPIWEPAI